MTRARTIAIEELTRHARRIESVFDLLGTQENDLTAALGFALARAPTFADHFVKSLGGKGRAAAIDMEVRDDLGRTDLEVQTGAELFVIEAKRGWHLPSEEQLRSYAPRVSRRGEGALVTLSDCSADWAGAHLPAEVDGVEVRHLPWSVVRADLLRARRATRGAERFWLTELDDYLKRVVHVVDPSDMWTYCVVVSGAQYGPFTFRQWVQDERVYFWGFGWGHGWPKEPPNFLAFRWDNYVQQVNRVISHEIVDSLRTRWAWPAGASDDSERPHVVCNLGPPLRMEAVPTGRSYRATRMWVLLDQLFTTSTLAEALEATERLSSQ